MKKGIKIMAVALGAFVALQTGSAFLSPKADAAFVTAQIKASEKSFTKEELEAKKTEYKAQKIEAKEYFKEIKSGFGSADKDTKKEILAEIASVKAEIKDDSIGVFVRGKEIDFDKYDGVKPKIENSRTLIPIRAISEALGAEVVWNEETQEITITRGENIVILTIGSTTVKVNGEEEECEVAPKIENGRTLVPVRIVSEALKEKVEWDSASRTVIIEEDEEKAEEVIVDNFDVEDFEEKPLEEIIMEEMLQEEEEPTPEDLEIGVYDDTEEAE